MSCVSQYLFPQTGSLRFVILSDEKGLLGYAIDTAPRSGHVDPLHKELFTELCRGLNLGSVHPVQHAPSFCPDAMVVRFQIDCFGRSHWRQLSKRTIFKGLVPGYHGLQMLVKERPVTLSYLTGKLTRGKAHKGTSI